MLVVDHAGEGAGEESAGSAHCDCEKVAAHQGAGRSARRAKPNTCLPVGMGQ